MPKKPKSSAVEIAEEAKPGWKAVAPRGPIKSIGAHERDLAYRLDDAAPADPMPSTDQLQSKARQESKSSRDAPAGHADDSAAPVLKEDTEIVDMKSGDVVRPVGVNTSTRKLDWSAG